MATKLITPDNTTAVIQGPTILLVKPSVNEMTLRVTEPGSSLYSLKEGGNINNPSDYEVEHEFWEERKTVQLPGTETRVFFVTHRHSKIDFGCNLSGSINVAKELIYEEDCAYFDHKAPGAFRKRRDWYLWKVGVTPDYEHRDSHKCDKCVCK